MQLAVFFVRPHLDSLFLFLSALYLIRVHSLDGCLCGNLLHVSKHALSAWFDALCRSICLNAGVLGPCVVRHGAGRSRSVHYHAVLFLCVFFCHVILSFVNAFSHCLYPFFDCSSRESTGAAACACVVCCCFALIRVSVSIRWPCFGIDVLLPSRSSSLTRGSRTHAHAYRTRKDTLTRTHARKHLCATQDPANETHSLVLARCSPTPSTTCTLPQQKHRLGRRNRSPEVTTEQNRQGGDGLVDKPDGALPVFRVLRSIGLGFRV